MATEKDLFIKTLAGTASTNALVVGIGSANAPAPAGQALPVTLGDIEPTRLYFCDGVGGYDATINGTLKYSVTVPGAIPTGGTFWLGFGIQTSGVLVSGKRYQITTFVAGDSFTNVGAASNASLVEFVASGTTPTTWSNGSTLIEITTDLAFNAADTVIQTALNAMASITAAGGVICDGEIPSVIIEFVNVGARETISGNGLRLFLDGQAFVQTMQTGTSVIRARQHMRLLRVPFVLHTAWTPITNGYSGDVNYGTQGLFDYLGSRVSRGEDLTLEVEHTDTSGRPRTLLSVPIVVRNEGASQTSGIPTPLTGYYTTTQSDALFVSNAYTVTGLTGGGATNLDGIATTSLTTKMAALKIAGALAFYRLEAGTDAESSPTVIRPDDYNGATNAKVWKLATISVGNLAGDESLTFSAAGNTDVTPTAGANQHNALITPSAGAGIYTRTVSILTANAANGTECELRIAMPASVNPTIEIRNATSGGTLLKTISPSTRGLAFVVLVKLVYRTSAWVVKATLYESAENLRFSGNALQILDDVDNTTWRTLRCDGGALYTI